MLNSNMWNWGSKTGFFWAGTGACSLVWTYFRLPELAGRTFGELDVLFGAKVPARKFATTTIDQFKTIESEMTSQDVEKSSEKDDAASDNGLAVVQLLDK